MDGNEALEEVTEEFRAEAYKRKQRLASSVLILALSDSVLRIVHPVKAHPFKMLKNLDDRHASETAASNTTKATNLARMKYTSLRSDVGDNVDERASTVRQLRGMDVTFQNSFAMAILVASIEALHSGQPLQQLRLLLRMACSRILSRSG